MPRQIFVVPAIALSIASGCTSRTPSPPVLPIPSTPITPGLSPTTQLRFSPGTYRYRLSQTAQIQGDQSLDTLPSTIITEASFLVRVTSDNDSIFQLTVSIDSISIATKGSIPPPRISQASPLDSVLHITFTPTRTTTQVHLPDSLCTYGHLVATAREILAPEFALWIESPSKQLYSDTATVTTCRAGILVQGLTTRQLRDSGREPPEFSIEQTTAFNGAGLLRRDSITISGSTVTRGTLSFQPGNRLPSRVQTNSEGTVIVQLGTSRTVFRQRSAQEIKLETAIPPD